LVAWSGPYAGVWLADGLLRRWRFDLSLIHPQPGERTRRPTWRAWAAFAVGAVLAALTMKSPLYQGPINQRLGGMDLSWVLGLVSSAGVYAALARRKTA
jgi:purine-cytosine permease-like protein